MKNEKKVTWFVSFVGSVTNKIISNLLGKPEPEVCYYDYTCADGEQRNLWELSNYDKVAQLERSVKDYGLQFTVFKKEGKYGKITEFNFKRLKRKPGGNLVKDALKMKKEKRKLQTI